MLSPETDKPWTAEFAPGSYFEGSWGAVRELLAAWNTIAVATADADAAAMCSVGRSFVHSGAKTGVSGFSRKDGATAAPEHGRGNCPPWARRVGCGLIDWRGDAVEDDWVQIENCNWVHEANLVVSVLAGDGIEAFLPDAYTLGTRPELAAALGGVRVLVRASDADRAREVLAAAIPDLPTSGEGEHAE